MIKGGLASGFLILWLLSLFVMPFKVMDAGPWREAGMFEEASKPFWLSCQHPDKWLPSGRSTARGSAWSLPSAAAGHILSSLQIAILSCLKGDECLPRNIFTKVKPDTIYAALRTRARSGKHSINISCCCHCMGFLLLLLSLCHCSRGRGWPAGVLSLPRVERSQHLRFWTMVASMWPWR